MTEYEDRYEDTRPDEVKAAEDVMWMVIKVMLVVPVVMVVAAMTNSQWMLYGVGVVAIVVGCVIPILMMWGVHGFWKVHR